MSNVLCSLLASVVLSVTNAALAADERLIEPTEDIWREYRMVRDIVRLDLGRIGDHSGPWVIADIKPDDLHYQERPNWWMTEDGTPVVEAPRTLSERTLSSGRVDIRAVLAGHAPPIRGYISIARNGDIPPRPGRSDQIYSPFESLTGGTIICRINDSFPGRFRFMPAFLIPDRWVRFLTAPQRGPWPRELFDVQRLHDNRQRLVDMTRGEDPFLAIAAYRVLATFGGSDEQLLQSMGSSADLVVQGAMCRLLLGEGGVVPRPRRAEQLAQLVSETSKFELVRGVALGLRVLLIDLDPRDPFLESDVVLRSLIKKASEPGCPKEDKGFVELVRLGTLARRGDSASGGTAAPGKR